MTAVAPMLGLATAEKFLLMMLANYAGPDATLFHSQATMAKDTAMGERTVRVHLATLEARGLIIRTPRYSRGSRTSDIIKLTFIPAIPAAMAPPIPENYDRHTGRKRSLIPAESAGEPIIEPVSNPSRARALAPRDRAAPSVEDCAERKRVGAMMAELAAELGARKP